MIIYEVNIKINPEIVNEFDEWLDEHIEKMLQFEGFKSANKFNSIEDEQYFLTVQYKVKTQEDLDRYFRNYAEKMRKEGIKKFSNNYSTFFLKRFAT